MGGQTTAERVDSEAENIESFFPPSAQPQRASPRSPETPLRAPLDVMPPKSSKGTISSSYRNLAISTPTPKLDASGKSLSNGRDQSIASSPAPSITGSQGSFLRGLTADKVRSASTLGPRASISASQPPPIRKLQLTGSDDDDDDDGDDDDEDDDSDDGVASKVPANRRAGAKVVQRPKSRPTMFST